MDRNELQDSPILIVGAGRSGSKMLRGILNHAPQTVMFPREINYIWRHGNASFPSDELGVGQARPEVASFIRKRFRKLGIRAGGRRVIEKTCANSLRVPFIHAIFPEAHIIHLIRDGRAVAESARRRWLAPPDARYLLEKSRWVPLVDLPYYGLRFMRFQMARLSGKQGSPSSWGPRFSGMESAIREYSLLEVCGIQWRACVQAASQAAESLPVGQVTTVRYEKLVQDPIAVSRELFARIGLTFDETVQSYLETNLTTRHVDKWQDRLTGEDHYRLLAHIADELRAQGYNV